MSEEFETMDDDVWDQETMLELRRFGLEHALMAHMHKRDGAVELNTVFRDADRIVNYVLGDLNP